MRCNTEIRSVGWFYSNQRKLDFEPVYQREGGAWSQVRKQLFIDSLLNNFDIPKIYLHELNDGEIYDFAVVDGKQRIMTLISFMNNEFPLDEKFEYEGGELSKIEFPQAGNRFQDFPPVAQQLLRDVQLATTVVRKADSEEIEQLFSRLNDGEPLNNAETRNAFGGSMVALIRDIADRDFFQEWVGYSNKRFAHRETACRLIFLESEFGRTGVVPDINKRALDDFVRDNKSKPSSVVSKLARDVDTNLTFMQKCFEKKSKELSKQSLPQLYYLWLSQMKNRYAHKEMTTRLRDFIEDFAMQRILNNKASEDAEKNPYLTEFSYLSAQGTNNSASMARRLEILTMFFLLKYPDTQLLSKSRVFSKDEKYVIWLKADKKCSLCKVPLENFSNFDADHVVRYADGGPTTLENAQALCASCNRSKG